jgi:hypothetical protein
VSWLHLTCSAVEIPRRLKFPRLSRDGSIQLPGIPSMLS